MDAEKLAYYLAFNEPKISSKIIKSESFSSSENLNEREILYKILFDLKKDVTELKKILLQVIESGNEKAYDILHENLAVFQDVASSSSIDKLVKPNLALPKAENVININGQQDDEMNDNISYVVPINE